MSELRSVCLLGLGEVGSRLASDLDGTAELQLRAWDRQFMNPGSKPSATLQRFSRLTAAADAATAAKDCELIISAVTAAEDQEAARSVLPAMKPGTWFLDLNSVSPGSKQAVAEVLERAGGRYVEAAIMSPIEPLGIAAPILLGGPHANAFLPLANHLGFSAAQFCSAEIGQAAAAKMCRSVVIKGMEALLTEALLTARHYGVEDQVIASLENLFPRPDWAQHARYMISRSLLHGLRRAEEMREAALTVSEAGIEPRMSAASADRQDWAAQFVAALEHGELAAMLDAISDALQEQQHWARQHGEQQQRMGSA